MREGVINMGRVKEKWEKGEGKEGTSREGLSDLLSKFTPMATCNE
jgi:hypothetical protein